MVNKLLFSICGAAMLWVAAASASVAVAASVATSIEASVAVATSVKTPVTAPAATTSPTTPQANRPETPSTKAAIEQQKPEAPAKQAQTGFTFEDYKNGAFGQRPSPVRGIQPSSDGEHYTVQQGRDILKFSYANGEQVGNLLQGSHLSFSSYLISLDEQKILLTTNVKPIYRHSYAATNWVYDIKTKSYRQLTEKGAEQVATFSPDGTKVAFVRENDLYYVDLTNPQPNQTRITTDGKFGHIINGIPDWVYEEEFIFSQAYEWAPDSRSIAYMRFDETEVSQYNMNTFSGELYPQNYAFKYPKAGQRNSTVEVYTYNIKSGQSTRIDVGSEPDQYIPRIKWTPRSELLVYRLNRLQNCFEVLHIAKNGISIIYQERNDRYVERIDDGVITFLPDGNRFIVRSEREEYMHLYLHSISEGYIGPITSGQWEVTELCGVSDDRVYYISTETSALKRDLWRVDLKGKNKVRLTAADGTYSVSPSIDFKYFISNFSNVSTPTIISVLDSEGKHLRTIEDNSELRSKIADMGVPIKEFFTFRTSEGVELNGYMIRPVGFDPTQRYPLFMTQYSGPGSQSVADRWSMGWEDVLAQQGYIVACVDGRGTGFRGAEFKKCTYGQLGKYETIDQIEAARYLGSLPYVDQSRIGIYGWSYGGFMALNCLLKGSDVFSLAISVAPVTNWRFYDTIYTELYNGLPQDNPLGYDQNSPINFASGLKGKLLIAHGTGDDNVHIQNTYEMISKLLAHNKDFEMFIAPDQNHSMGSAHWFLLGKCVDFVKTNL